MIFPVRLFSAKADAVCRDDAERLIHRRRNGSREWAVLNSRISVVRLVPSRSLFTTDAAFKGRRTRVNESRQ